MHTFIVKLFSPFVILFIHISVWTPPSTESTKLCRTSRSTQPAEAHRVGRRSTGQAQSNNMARLRLLSPRVQLRRRGKDAAHAVRKAEKAKRRLPKKKQRVDHAPWRVTYWTKRARGGGRRWRSYDDGGDHAHSSTWNESSFARVACEDQGF